MKKTLAILATLSLTTFTGVAGSAEVVDGMKNKIVRGVVDIVTGIVEVPVQICKGYNNGFGPIDNTVGSKTVGTILGFFRGFGHAGGRFVSGGSELFGFWTANAVDNYGIGVPFDAEYSWEEGIQYSYFDPSLSEGVKPVGRKLARGVTDGLLGVAEFPGQILRGASDGNIVMGVGKGLWYWVSREAQGFTGVLGCIVPNHEDNLGHAYEGDWPWSALSDSM